MTKNINETVGYFFMKLRGFEAETIFKSKQLPLNDNYNKFDEKLNNDHYNKTLNNLHDND